MTGRKFLEINEINLVPGGKQLLKFANSNKKVRAVIFTSVIIICSGIFYLSVLHNPPSCPALDMEPDPADRYVAVMKQDLLCLMTGYPGFVSGIEIEDRDVYVVMKSGKRILYDDKKPKEPAKKLDNPDLQDMLEQIYPLSRADGLSDPSFDPGRVRVYELFREVYGDTKQEIEKNLVNVPAGSATCRFNSRNNAAEKLSLVFRELAILARGEPVVYQYISRIGGTYNYRYISGTGRLSAHAFGTAIDLAVSSHDYWQWATREQGLKRLFQYPMSVVDIFEGHGFIWGGKWGHFDLMHYEYRPGIIMKARYFPEKLAGEGSWYGDIGRFNDSMRKCIYYIDEIVGEAR